MISLNGDINTGILIRTTYLRDGMASLPGGRHAALRFRAGHGRARDAPQGHRLFPHAGRGRPGAAAGGRRSASRAGAGVRLLLVDNDDCFIHTLANYARQTGAEVVTYRAGFPPELIAQMAPNLILISPGPGPPGGFRRAGPGEDRRAAGRARCSACAWDCRALWRRSAASWACSITPCTASPRTVRHRGIGVFEGLPEEFQVGRYHSLFARRETLPGVPGSDRGDRRRRDHGRAPPRAADRGRAVPSRIDPHAPKATTA